MDEIHAPAPRQLLGREQVLRPAPANLKEGDEALFQHEYAREIGPTVLLEKREVHVLANGFLISRGLLLPESFVNPPRGGRRLKAFARMIQYRVFSRESRVSRALFVTDEFSNGYFHWICDVLPRLEALGSAGAAGRTLLVPAMANFHYVPQTIEPFTMADVRLLDWAERVFCRELLVVSPAAPTGNYRSSLMGALRNRMRGHFGARSAGRRIYISRGGAAVRRIANEEEILPLLERFGFETIRTEGLSFAEQVRAIGSASVLASNHGAGLTNMCWMRPGSKVLELRKDGDRDNNCYYSLAAALGIRYHYLCCRATPEHSEAHTADLLVDGPRLEGELAALG